MKKVITTITVAVADDIAIAAVSKTVPYNIPGLHLLPAIIAVAVILKGLHSWVAWAVKIAVGV